MTISSSSSRRRPEMLLLWMVVLMLSGIESAGALSLLGKKSTAQQVYSYLDQNNQLAPYAMSSKTAGTVVVTGGNSGIGAETVRILAQNTNMDVIVCARNLESANLLVEELHSSTNGQRTISAQYMDLGDLESVKQATESIIQEYGTIDCIINNAGIMSIPKRETTVDGIELQFGTNHVGHHYFTRLLLPYLNDNGRVVTVASTAHQFALSTTDWQSENKYSAFGSYGTSKLANILFAKSLQDKMKESGRADLKSISLHPGVISSPLWKHTLPSFLLPAVGLIANKSIEQGAATNVYCALAKYVEGGAYYDDCGVATPQPSATSISNREALWEYTESLLATKGFDMPKSIVSSEKEMTLEESR